MDAETSYQALTRVHPRTLQVLLARFVAKTASGDGRSFADFAAFYGVPEASAKVLLWRAAQEVDAVCRNVAPPGPLDFADEQRAAEALHAALDAPLPPTSQELVRQVDALRALSTHAATLRDRLAEAERAELQSPGYARETWLRRVAIVVVLAVSAWFYWKDDLTRWWRQWRSPAEISAPDSGR